MNVLLVRPLNPSDSMLQTCSVPVTRRVISLVVFGWVVAGNAALAQEQQPMETVEGDRLVTEYFRSETERLSVDVLSDGMTLDQWKKQQTQDRGRLADMLGLDPMPPRSPLQAEVVSVEDRAGVRVERLHFQPSPGLYVAANLYRPQEVDEPLPTILYVCGHARVIDDGVSAGNKTAYHHHGVWFAKNGYVCLIVDTVQWGEFLGDHHGTYRLGRWWWNNRGYTPAGVEAWTGIRALDYLETRPEVDASRFGITGRSGGGVYSWWIAALDQRIKVAVPVAGITTLKNYVVDDCVEGHCDCMFMVNTDRWDFPRVAALVAPRPLLISNSDKDTIFPLEGVVEVHRQVRDVYRLHGEQQHLGLQITEGPHRDTQELRVHAFRWFNRFLKQDESLIQMPADKVIEPDDLKVFKKLPSDERVTKIAESFVPAANGRVLAELAAKGDVVAEDLQQSLQRHVFAGWPNRSDTEPLNVRLLTESSHGGLRCRVYSFRSQLPYELPFYVLDFPAAGSDDSKRDAAKKTVVEIVDQDRWNEVASAISVIAPDIGLRAMPSPEALKKLRSSFQDDSQSTHIYFAPRGIGPTRWNTDTRESTHIRRRFMLLGQTADSMRIYDVRRLLRAINDTDTLASADVQLLGNQHAAAWALHACLDTPVDRLTLVDLPSSYRDGITLLNVSRIVTMSDVVWLAARQVPMDLICTSKTAAQSWRGLLTDGALTAEQLSVSIRSN